MSCNAKKTNASAESARRARVCIQCVHSSGDVCGVVEAKHPGASSIESGTKRMELACPEGLWDAVPAEQLQKTRCKYCTRLWLCNADGVCAFCINKQKHKGKGRPKPVEYPRIRHDLSGIHASTPIKTDGDWFVAITTSPRRDCTLRQCIASMRDAGWEPTIFAEPGSTKTNAQTLTNPTKLGVWRNWLASAQYAIANTTAERILTVQDDSIFHPDSKSFVESMEWPSPDAAFVSLYTPSHYSKGRSVGVNQIVTRSLWGACAMLWDRDALAAVIRHEIALTWLGAPAKGGRSVYAKRKAAPSMIANSDTAIGKICNAMGKSMWFIDPSPVYHAAVHSTIAHGNNTGFRNCGRCADHSKPLFDQVMPLESR